MRATGESRKDPAIGEGRVSDPQKAGEAQRAGAGSLRQDSGQSHKRHGVRERPVNPSQWRLKQDGRPAREEEGGRDARFAGWKRREEAEEKVADGGRGAGVEVIVSFVWGCCPRRERSTAVAGSWQRL